MARLIVLNGPPGVGKTTIAGRYLDDHPSALNANIDGVRRLLGGWRDDPNRAGLIARSLTLAMARHHLGDGYDVVLPQYLGNPAFLEQAEAVAEDAGAGFFEFVLMDDRDSVVRRFNERSARAEDPAHVDAARIVERLGGDDLLFTMYDRLLLLVSTRPAVHVLHCPEGAAARVYGELLAFLS